MPFLWLPVADGAERGSVERSSIALTSRLAQGLDPPSASWFGYQTDRTKIRQSGLCNIDHVHHIATLGRLHGHLRLARRFRGSAL